MSMHNEHYDRQWTMVDNEQWWTIDNGGQWTMVDNGQWWTMYNGGQCTMVDNVQW